jgi:hypothetical protein
VDDGVQAIQVKDAFPPQDAQPVDPQVAERAAQQLEKQARGSAAKTAWKDLYSSLGPTWRIYNSAGEGGLLVTGTTVILDVDDPKRFDQAFKKLKVLMRAEGLNLREFEFHGKVIRYLGGSVGGNNEIVVPLSWMIEDGKLIGTVSPQILKAHIRRRESTHRRFIAWFTPAA